MLPSSALWHTPRNIHQQAARLKCAAVFEVLLGAGCIPSVSTDTVSHRCAHVVICLIYEVAYPQAHAYTSLAFSLYGKSSAPINTQFAASIYLYVYNT